ncbi:MAG TPA: metal ABC transporter substrate-binding protein [Anaerolineales bacterium]|nr:metal ABC transporter substrate-binding protein [Anaerolineales bacterium]
MIFRTVLLSAILMFFLAACNTPTDDISQQDHILRVVATTNIVGDVVSQVGGDAIELTVLLPPGTDPHSFQPTPQDMARAADAQVIFMNGAGLEAFMQSLLEKSGSQARLVEVSQDIALLEAVSHGESEGDDAHSEEGEHAGDPHVWMDPNNVLIWVDHIESTLVEIDPRNAALYKKNAESYRQELIDLDRWILEQVTQIPEANRELVTDHQLFIYFADRYGFEQIGAIVPGYSTLSEPSAQELAQLEDAIRELGVRAIFVGNTVNPGLAQRLANDTGTKLVFFYTGSLTEATGPAATYLDYMRFNVLAIVDALK